MTELTTLTLGPAQMHVLRTLLEFHQDDLTHFGSAEEMPYDNEAYEELCRKVGVIVPPEQATETTAFNRDGRQVTVTIPTE